MVLGLNSGGTAPIWTALSWDDLAGVSGADLVHNHSEDAEGGQSLLSLIELGFNSATELTISSRSVTRTQVFHTIDTENDDPSDELDTIAGGSDGKLIIIRPADDARTVVVKHNTGNIWLMGQADISLDDAGDALMLLYVDALSKWVQIGGGGSGGGGAPTNAQYLVLALDGTLTAERRFVPGDGLQATDGGAGGDYTLNIDVSDFAGDGLEDDGAENLRIAAAAAGDGLQGGGGSALAVDSTVVRTSGDQTVGGCKTFSNTVAIYDGLGDSPELQFAGGSNDDTIRIFLDDEAVAGNSDLVIKLCDTANSDIFIRASDDTLLATIGPGGIEVSSGDLVLDDGAGNSPSLKFVGGSNDDTATIYLEDNAVAGQSDLFLLLPGNTWLTKFEIRNSDTASCFSVRGDGDANFNMDVSIEGNLTMTTSNWIGFGASAGRIVFDSTPTPDSIEFQDCHVGIGPVGSATTTYLLIQDTSLECTGYWYGIFADMTKTAGATDENDYMHGGRFEFTMNDSDSTIGFLRGIYVMAELDAGTIGTAGSQRLLYGAQIIAKMDDGTINGSLYAGSITADVNEDTITNDIVGLAIAVAVDSNVDSIGDDVFGIYLYTDVDKDPSGVVYGVFLSSLTNSDYGFYQQGSGVTNHMGGDLYVTGTLTNAGGSDPPYELYWDGETRDSVIERVRRGVPPSRLGGMVVFFNSETGNLELYRPTTGEFFTI